MGFLNYLTESLDSKPYETTEVKSDSSNIAYEFTDEVDHTYKLWVYKNTKLGKNVWVAILSEKTPSAKGYKRIISQFKNANRVIATCIDLIDKLVNDRIINGLVFELPTKVFEKKKSIIKRLAQTKIKKMKFADVDFTDDELDRIDLTGIVLIKNGLTYKNVFTVGTHYEELDSDLHFLEAQRTIDRLLKKKKYSNDRIDAVHKYINDNLKLSSFDELEKKDTSDRYLELAHEVIGMIDNKEKEYRWMFKADPKEIIRRTNEPMEYYGKFLKKSEVEHIRDLAIQNTDDSIRDKYIGVYDIFQTDDEEVWRLYNASFEAIYHENYK